MFIIKIPNKLHPYSHRPRSDCLIPGTPILVSVAPGRLLLRDLSEKSDVEVIFGIRGPVTEFTVEQEIDKERIVVYMQSESGYIRYSLFVDDRHVVLRLEKSPLNGIPITTPKQTKKIVKRDEIVLHILTKAPVKREKPIELFLGSSKSQNVEMMRQRHQLEEFLPFLFALAQKSDPAFIASDGKGCFEIVDTLETTIEKGDASLLEKQITALYLTAFYDLLAPRSNDEDYVGMTISHSDSNPLALLPRLYAALLSCFVREEDGATAILPLLPHSLHTGKIKRILLPWGRLDFEWSKKKLRRAVLRPEHDCDLVLKLPHKFKSFRIHRGLKRSNNAHSASEPLQLKGGVTYYLDQFKS